MSAALTADVPVTEPVAGPELLARLLTATRIRRGDAHRPALTQGGCYPDAPKMGAVAGSPNE